MNSFCQPSIFLIVALLFAPTMGSIHAQGKEATYNLQPHPAQGTSYKVDSNTTVIQKDQYQIFGEEDSKTSSETKFEIIQRYKDQIKKLNDSNQPQKVHRTFEAFFTKFEIIKGEGVGKTDRQDAPLKGVSVTMDLGNPVKGPKYITGEFLKRFCGIDPNYWSMLPSKPVPIGHEWTTRKVPSFFQNLLDLTPPGTEATSINLSFGLEEVLQHKGTRCARIRVTFLYKAENEKERFTYKTDLYGNLYIDLSTGLPLEVNLRGDLESTQPPPESEEGVTPEVKTEAKVTIALTFSPIE